MRVCSVPRWAGPAASVLVRSSRGPTERTDEYEVEAAPGLWEVALPTRRPDPQLFHYLCMSQPGEEWSRGLNRGR